MQTADRPVSREEWHQLLRCLEELESCITALEEDVRRLERQNKGLRRYLTAILQFHIKRLNALETR